MIRFLISYVMVTILGVIMLFFLALNHPKVQIDLLDAQYSVSLPWIMGVAAVFGFLIALLMLLPGRIAAMVNTWALERELREVEQQYEELQMLRARLLADHEALVERHERMLIRFQHLVSDHREVVADQERTRRQIAAPNTPNVASAVQPASPPAARSKGIRSALRLLPPAAPAPAAPAPTAPSPRASAVPAQMQMQTPATAPAAHSVGATARDVRTEQPAPQQPTPQQPAPQERVQPAESTSSAIAVATATATAAITAPPPAPVAVAPARSQPRLVPVLTDPPASHAPAEQAEAQGASPGATESQRPRKPRVTAATLRRPVERLREGARQGWQRAEVQTERLRERMAVLRAGVEARLQRARSSASFTDDDEPSLADESTHHDDN
ncbi:MAG TPA: LapA family protein [Ktedonobacterales bacterium]|nr:LapA family protein [Ktedonobacterales bacterium]